MRCAHAWKVQSAGRNAAAFAHGSRRTAVLSLGAIAVAWQAPLSRADDLTDAGSPKVGQLEAFSDNIAQLEVQPTSRPALPAALNLRSLRSLAQVRP